MSGGGINLRVGARPVRLDPYRRGAKGEKGDAGERGLPGTPGNTRARDVPCILDYVGGTYGGDPTGTNSSSTAWRAFQEDCRTEQAVGEVSGKSGVWALDHDVPILVPPNAGFSGPRRAPNRLSWVKDGVSGAISSVLQAPGCTFLVDVTGPNRMVPKFAMQGNCVVSNVNFVGDDLLASAADIDVSEYGVGGSNTIYGSPTAHAPVLCTDHRHADDGTLLPNGTVSKSGGLVLENIRLIGLYDGIYLGDPLIDEEPWSASITSGLQSGIGDIEIDGIAGFVLRRVMGWARMTSGGLRVRRAQFIPPNWTGISQPIPAGPDYKLLKWAQENAVFAEGWHRSVGLLFDQVGLRGFRHAYRWRAGAGLGPDGQDTGKVNQAKFLNHSFERVQTLVEADEYSYMHLTRWQVSGHSMNEYNIAGSNANFIQMNTSGALAGAVDKAIDKPYLASHTYAAGDKFNNGGRIYSVTVGGTTPASGPGPVGTDPGATEVIGSATVIYRNDSFKNAGDYTVWINRFDIDMQEFAGGCFENTAYDPHPFYQFDYIRALNWRQPNSHHAEALFINRSATSLLRIANGVIQANSSSNHVFNVPSPDNLELGFVHFAGFTIALGDDGVPTDAIPAPLVNVTGVDFSMTSITDFGLGTDDDNSDDDDEG